jgi:hypothetical protein
MEAGSQRDVSLGDTLLRCWGYSAFRPHQQEVCEALVSGRDALVLMATGSGKSLCYQVPAAWAHSQPPGDRRGGQARLGRVCVVVSPLVSLMEDQVAGLASSGVPAVMLGGAHAGDYALEQVRFAKKTHSTPSLAWPPVYPLFQRGKGMPRAKPTPALLLLPLLLLPPPPPPSERCAASLP